MIEKLVLPLPVSSNRYWRVAQSRQGVPMLYMSKEAEMYKEEVGWLAKAAGVEVMEGEVSVQVIVYRKQKSGDLDNRLKVLLDALNGFAWTDDKQIVEIYALRLEDPGDPRVEVTVTPYKEN